MKTILVPTDFSRNADNAMHFAMILAKKQNARLILIHAYQLPVSPAAVPFSVLADEKEQLNKEAIRKIKALCQEIEHVGGISYEYLVEEGETVPTILQACEQKKSDLIVMGTKGATGLTGIIFGSTASHVLEKASCPVMAIPEASKFTRPIKKITYATDYRQSDIEAIHKLIEIASILQAQINILHISGDEISAEEEVQLMNEFRKKVTKSIFYNNLSFQLLHGNNVEEELEHYIANESTDMLVMATHFRNFIDRLFGKSLTKDIVEETNVPLIAFHYRETKPVKVF